MNIIHHLQSLSSGSTETWDPTTGEIARAFTQEEDLVTLAVAGVAALLVFAFASISNYLLFSEYDGLLEKREKALQTSEIERKVEQIEKLGERVEQLLPSTAPWSEWSTDCTCEQPYYVRTRNGNERETRSCRPTDVIERVRQTAGLDCNKLEAFPYIVASNEVTYLKDFSGFGFDCSGLLAGERESAVAAVLDGVGYYFKKNLVKKLDPGSMTAWRLIGGLGGNALLDDFLDGYDGRRLHVVTPEGKMWAVKGDPTLEFDPKRNDFTPGPEMPDSDSEPAPKNLEYHCVVKYDEDNVLVMGGEDYLPAPEVGPNKKRDISSDEVWNYSFSQGEWTKYPSLILPTAKSACAKVTTLDGQEKVLLVGGVSIRSPLYEERNVRIVQIFDIATKTWSVGRPFPIALSGAAGSEFGRSMLVMAGDTPDTSESLAIVYQYDVDRDEWFTRPETLLEPDEDVMAVPFLEAAGLCPNRLIPDYEGGVQLFNEYED